jgi:hypothetical protein
MLNETELKELPEIVQRAYIKSVIDIGQFTKKEIYQLNKAVKSGILSKDKDYNRFPIPKTRYSMNWNDFREMMMEQSGSANDTI